MTNNTTLLNNMQWYIGTSGWSYNDWKGRFYPNKMSDPVKRLDHYTQTFNTTEVNSTFYNSPNVKTIEQWAQTVPEGFRFVVKLNRYFTHMKRLKSDEAAGRKYESFRHIPETLGNLLGPVLVQLPGKMQKNTERLEQWLDFMPPLSYAFEFRHSSWFDHEVYKVLQKYNAALVYSHNRDFPTDLRCTADFMYLRFHGPEKPYYSKYSEEQLAGEIEKINLFLDECREIYVFFNNTHKAYAADNAKQWREMAKEEKEG